MTHNLKPNGVVMRGFGRALPPIRLTNEDMVAWHGHKDAAWLQQKIGVRYRHSCYDYRVGAPSGVDEDSLLVEASHAALDEAGLKIGDIDAILLSTSYPTHSGTPDSACVLHEALGARQFTSAMMMMAGCSGTLDTLYLASALIEAGRANHVLACSSAMMSSYFRPHLKERTWLQASIFGDGSAAIVVSRDHGAEGHRGFSPFVMGSSSSRDVAMRRHLGGRQPLEPHTVEAALQDHLVLDLHSVPKNLKFGFSSVCEEVLRRNELTLDDIDWILFNQSNEHVQRAWLAEMKIPPDKAMFNLAEVGNCAAASLGLLLHDFARRGVAKPGQRALLMATGTGLKFGGAVYQF